MSAVRLPQKLLKTLHPSLIPRYEQVKRDLDNSPTGRLFIPQSYDIDTSNPPKYRSLPPSPVQGPSATLKVPKVQIIYKTEQYSHLNKPEETKELTIGAMKYVNRFITPRIGVFGVKVGCTGWYDEWGARHLVTIIKIEDNQVYHTFRNSNDKPYTVVCARPKSPYMADFGIVRSFLARGLYPRRFQKAFRVAENAILPEGLPLYASHFKIGQFVDVYGKSRGLGFQGVMKRWGFRGMPATHGCSRSHRAPGAIGTRGLGRIWKGKKMAGRVGFKIRHSNHCRILRIDHAQNLLYVQGNVPGYANGLSLAIRDAIDNPQFKTNPPYYPTYVPGVHPDLPEIEDWKMGGKDPLDYTCTQVD